MNLWNEIVNKYKKLKQKLVDFRLPIKTKKYSLYILIIPLTIVISLFLLYKIGGNNDNKHEAKWTAPLKLDKIC